MGSAFERNEGFTGFQQILRCPYKVRVNLVRDFIWGGPYMDLAVDEVRKEKS